MTIQAGGRHILIQGLALILTGLLWGFVLPLTPYPRLAVGAHMQFETNGLLFAVLAILLLRLPHGIGDRAVRVIVVSTWLTWLMTLSEVANAWWGTNRTLPIAAGQAGAKGAAPWQELIVQLFHVAAALGLVVSVSMVIVGFVRRRELSE